MAEGTGTTMTDGSLAFDGGIDSVKVSTIASDRTMGGLRRNQLAWLTNGAVRDGGISQRLGWEYKGRIHGGSALYQGGYLYEPDADNPQLIVSIGGHIYRVLVDFTFPPTDLSAGFAGTVNPPTVDQAFFCQGEKYLVIQAGDYATLPLFWDGATLRRSLGITNAAVAPGTPGVNELPASGPMDYYEGRLWYAQGRQYSAGDIVGGQSGTLGNRWRDSILNVTENPLVLGGDGFTVPSNAGNIRTLFHNAQINSQLGQGQLLIGTRKAIYAQQVPPTRNDWIAATANNQPVQTMVQLVNGPVNDRCIAKVNGDVFYQTLEPAIASLFASVRNFGQWGNRSISANEYRVLQFNDRSLMRFASGIEFNNRLLQAILPKGTPQGVVHQGIIPLDFVPISSFGGAAAPVWEGLYEGLDILQMFSGDFGGRQRGFLVSVSRRDGGIDLWEMTDFLREDSNIYGEARNTTIVEFPAYTWGQELLLKKLVAAELWVDKVYGTVELTMEWRPDSDPCWKFWHKWKICVSRNTCEDYVNPICYPLLPHREGFRATMVLPKPPEQCESMTGRPAHIAYQIQPRLSFKGWMRVRGILLYAEPWEKKLYQGIVC